MCVPSFFSGSAEGGQANKKERVWPESGWALLVESYEEGFLFLSLATKQVTYVPLFCFLVML